MEFLAVYEQNSHVCKILISLGAGHLYRLEPFIIPVPDINVSKFFSIIFFLFIFFVSRFFVLRFWLLFLNTKKYFIQVVSPDYSTFFAYDMIFREIKCFGRIIFCFICGFAPNSCDSNKSIFFMEEAFLFFTFKHGNGSTLFVPGHSRVIHIAVVKWLSDTRFKID